MKPFMDKDFLLDTQTAKALYFDCAQAMPIIDYHCHINPKDIADDLRFTSITELWLGGDHYKWRLMRSNGAPEETVTGAAQDYEKFYAYVCALERAPGHPLYHWSHLELQRYFGIYEPLTSKNAKTVFDRCNDVLARPEMSAKGIIRRSGVAVICTTDDPADSLEHHARIARDLAFRTRVLPTFRPDKALQPEKPGFAQYIERLADAAQQRIQSLDELKLALSKRLAFFRSNGAVVTDHGLQSCVYVPFCDEEANEVFETALQGGAATPEQLEGYKTNLLLYLGREYHKQGLVMQLHFGCLRDNNQRMYELVGPDTGFDAVYQDTRLDKLSEFLNELERENSLPKTILYSLNPQDNQAIVSLIGCFQQAPAGKIQHGSAWWFNDTKAGMSAQLSSLAQGGVLGNFIGMLTDSRSLLSYTRHEYFRRILCAMLGRLAEDGEYPCDVEALGDLVKDVCCRNAARYFGLEGLYKLT